MSDDNYDRGTGEVVPAERHSAPAPSQGERNLIFTSPECGEIFGALAEAQGRMENPKKTRSAKVQGTTKSGGTYNYEYKYAPLDEVIDVIRAPLAEARLVHRQFLAQRDGNWVMRTIIAHVSGQWYGCDYPVFVDKPGAQGFASGVTYARRYGLMLALGLVGEDDDDANVADGNVAKIENARETPAEARQTQVSAPAATRASGNRPQAAPAPSAAKEEATKRWKELRDLIEGAIEARDLEGIDGCQAWVQCGHKIDDAEGAGTSEGVMEGLRDRIARKRALIVGGIPDPDPFLDGRPNG